jgi:plastocyanin domain-containing protein
LWRALSGTAGDARDPLEVAWRAGVDPGEVVVAARAPIRLTFKRQDVTEATETVCFPDFGIVATLPPFVATTVDVGVRPPGRYVFCSADRDISGCLVVK